ncbi:MAG: prepilin peptidase [Chloroflexi bacterium]|nr:prepilin peptidase [Chloroflexota bacterium]
MELVQGCAVSAASVAALIDVWSRRIPNWVTFGTLLGGVLINAWLHGFSGALLALTGAGLGLALLLPFYMMRAIGAGDVKLLAAIGALIGPSMLVSVAVYGALVGGAMSVFVLVRRRLLLRTLGDMLAGEVRARSGATAPYGVAIASGMYLSLLLPAVIS